METFGELKPLAFKLFKQPHQNKPVEKENKSLLNNKIDQNLSLDDESHIDHDSFDYGEIGIIIEREFAFETRQNNAVKLLTRNIVGTFKMCNQDYSFEETMKPRRELTLPAEGVYNDGRDNEEYNLIVCVEDEIKGPGYTYTILNIIGQGVSGQVFKCVRKEDDKQYAMKIIKNKKAYNTQALIELRILEFLNNEVDKQDLYHIIRLFDHFYYKEHLCIVFELLNENLYELLKQNYFQGISLNAIQFIIKQILEAVYQLQKANLIHCDLKPENVLLKIDKEHNRDIIIKITDFGSSCFKNHTMFDYIQSRYYRAPEVLIGTGYGWEIDMWSIGCISAELFIGEPIFPGSCEYDQIFKICKLLGDMPYYLLRNAKKRKKFFIQETDKRVRLKTVEEYYKEFPDDMEPKYEIPYDLKSLDELTYKILNKKHMTANYSNSSHLSNSTKDHTLSEQECFTNFIKGLLTIDPSQRWNAKQALRHPFITKEKWEGYFNPHQEEISQFHFLEGSYLSESIAGNCPNNKYPHFNMHHSMMNFTNFQQGNNNYSNHNYSATGSNSFISNPSMDLSTSVYQPCMQNIPLKMLKNFPYAKIDQMNLKPEWKNQRKKGSNKNHCHNNYNNNKTFTMTSHEEIFDNLSFNSGGCGTKYKKKFEKYNCIPNQNQNQNFTKNNLQNNLGNMIPGVKLPCGYFSNSNINDMSYDKRFLAEQAMNKSLFYQKDKNYYPCFKEYEGLMSNNGAYANFNKSFDDHSRSRSKSEYNQYNNLNSHKHNNYCNVNQPSQGGNTYSSNNCVNLSCSNYDFNPYINDKENVYNRRNNKYLSTMETPVVSSKILNKHEEKELYNKSKEIKEEQGDEEPFHNFKK